MNQNFYSRLEDDEREIRRYAAPQPEQPALTDGMVVRGAEHLHDALRAVGCYHDFDVDLLGTDTSQYIAESVFNAMLDARNES